MIVRLRPFPQCLALLVALSPLDYVLFAGKLWDCVPKCVPETVAFIEVFIDAPSPDPAESLEWLLANETWARARAREALIGPEPMDVNPYIASSQGEKGDRL